MPHATPLIATIVAGLCIAFVFGAIANRFKIPPLAGYLLAGIIVGPFTPGYVADQHIAPELAEIGVILLMFGVGLHFSLKDLLAVKRIAVPGALVQIAFATLLGWGAARVFGWSSGAGIVFGLSLSVASTVVLLRALQDLRLLDTDQGRIAVGWLIVEDLVMVLALVLLPPLAGLLGGSDDAATAGGAAPVASTGSLLWTLTLTLAKVVAFIAVMLVVGRRVIPWVLSQIVKTGSKELFTLGVLAIALGVAFGSASIFGVSFALGAFFAGMILGESEMSHDAAEDILPLRDAFSVLFFVSVGMLFDFHVLIERPIQVLVTCLIIIVGKSVAALAIVRLFKRSTETALTIAASLAQIGEFSFILAGLGVSLHLLPESGRDLVLAGAILSIILNPFVFVVARRLTSSAGRTAANGLSPATEAMGQHAWRDGAASDGDLERAASGAGSTGSVTSVPSHVYAASSLGPVSTAWTSEVNTPAPAMERQDNVVGSDTGARTARSDATNDVHSAFDGTWGAAAEKARATGLADEAARQAGIAGKPDEMRTPTDTAAAGASLEETRHDEETTTGRHVSDATEVIIVGYGRVGREVVRTLLAGVPRNIVVIEDRPDMHARLRDAHVRSVCGNAVQPDVLRQAGLANARFLIVAIPNAFEAAEVIRHARLLAPGVRILARAGNTAELQHLEAHGAHAVVIEKHEIARGLARELADTI
ncbi:cation:proton antiporter domain-containing protein [Robbsia andropogonis]|uniref:cation:proton antiporter domain-containing protein n=1 Tax=Robbsia andropogonis TaxID=28092 RepID=UPI00046413C1|nr:cation:proton antiporter [Robbsia andropogonis]MCP1121129.1 cation:proton antiporter [Robbsia andropogonis]MCP1130922.1 cation:proton antiporter [Robbsia andropogonis]